MECFLFLITGLLLVFPNVSTQNAILEATNCLELYKGNDTGGGVTWQEGRDLCQENGKQLLQVTDSSIQRRAGGLIQDLEDDIDGVWLAGHRLQDSNWSLLDGRTFSADVTDVEQAAHCVHFQRTSLRSDQCTEASSPADPLCQTTAIDGQCQPKLGHTLTKVDETCYYLSEANINGVTWYEAQTYCWEQLGGELAYTHAHNSTILGSVSKGRTVWLGVTRYSWVSDTDNQRLPYYNWDRGQPNEADTSFDRIFLITSSKWRSINSTSVFRYFMCTEEKHLSPPINKQAITLGVQTSTEDTVTVKDTATDNDLSDTGPPTTATCHLRNGDLTISMIAQLSVLATISAVSIAVNIFLGIRTKRLQTKLKQSQSQSQSDEPSKDADDHKGQKLGSQTQSMTKFTTGVNGNDYNEVGVRYSSDPANDYELTGEHDPRTYDNEDVTVPYDNEQVARTYGNEDNAYDNEHDNFGSMYLKPTADTANIANQGAYQTDDHNLSYENLPTCLNDDTDLDSARRARNIPPPNDEEEGDNKRGYANLRETKYANARNLKKRSER